MNWYFNEKELGHNWIHNYFWYEKKKFRDQSELTIYV